MERQAATDLVERHRLTAFRKGYMIAKGTQRTPRFRETCKVEERLTSQLIDALCSTTEAMSEKDVQMLVDVCAMDLDGRDAP